MEILIFVVIGVSGEVIFNSRFVNPGNPAEALKP